MGPSLWVSSQLHIVLPTQGWDWITEDSHGRSGHAPKTLRWISCQAAPGIPSRPSVPHQDWAQGAAFWEELLLRTLPLKVKQCLSLKPAFRDCSPTSLHPRLVCLKENMVRMEIHSNLQRQSKQETEEGHSRLATLECLLSKQNLFYLLFQDDKYTRVIWSLNAPFGLR